MKFTATEMCSIERTMDKLSNVAFTVWERDTFDGSNARAIAYIIGEMRVCADLMQSEDRTTRLAAADRLVSLITK